jgi:D-psicose/D-tagatose/L-ribulose 3-epimerase
MVRYGAHAMVWVKDWTADEAATAVKAASAAGYDTIEIPIFDPQLVDLAQTRDLLRQYALTPTVSLGLSADTDISSADASISRAGVDRMVAIVDATAAIGGSIVAGVIASAWQKYAVPPTAANYNNSVAGLREVAQEARTRGVTLAIEVVNRFESNLINTAADALRFVDRIGEDNARIHLDSFHMHIEEPDAALAISLCGPRLAYVHINENHRGYLGTGSIDFRRIFLALAQAGYEGTIAFEAFSGATASPSTAGKAAIWRSVYEDADDVGRRALAFMQQGMELAERTVRLAGGRKP